MVVIVAKCDSCEKNLTGEQIYRGSWYENFCAKCYYEKEVWRHTMYLENTRNIKRMLNTLKRRLRYHSK